MPPAERTSATLIGRLRAPDDHAAWSDFVSRYGPHICRWCRRWNLREDDVQEVTQAVLVRLAERMRSFQYDPAKSFRAYLKTLTRYAWHDLLAERKRPGAGSGDTAVHDLLASVEAGDDLGARVEAEYERELFEEASARVRVRIEPRTWEAFRLTAIDGLSGAEAAARVGMEVATVFKARSKVQKMLQDEVRKLDPQP